MENTLKSSALSERKEKQLESILFLLQSAMEDFNSEIDRSTALLKIGEKTSLSKTIEKSIENPLESLIGTSKNIGQKIKQILDKIVVSHFNTNKDLLSAVYRNNTNSDSLSYSIILKNDTFENRNKIFSIFDFLYSIEGFEEFPISFQFVPDELVSKINIKGEINIVN